MMVGDYSSPSLAEVKLFVGEDKAHDRLRRHEGVDRIATFSLSLFLKSNLSKQQPASKHWTNRLFYGLLFTIDVVPCSRWVESAPTMRQVFT